ncbi:MAG: PD40 domain-containing protein [Candidatus Aminicenantes bacterium]|nr:PD40 domain-containing protein [Candidatus Aminicenantes bacterium]
MMGCTKKADCPDLSGPYLGQKPPGKTPELFAPGIVSKGYAEYQIAFTPNGKELYLWLGENKPYCLILWMSEENGRWKSFQVCPFSGKYVDMKFSLSPDGKSFLFSSNRPHLTSGEPADHLDIWFMERSSGVWGKPIRFGPAVNSNNHDYYPSMAGNGNVYFMSDRDGGIGEDDIYVSYFKDGKLTKAENIGPTINTVLNEGDPFIALDEGYLIFCSRDRVEGFGNNDLYIS